nr:MAG TPA: hypothetical protein [Microviridae sp.]
MNYKRGSVTLKTMPSLRCVATVVAHEKHRPSGVKSRRRQFSLCFLFLLMQLFCVKVQPSR